MIYYLCVKTHLLVRHCLKVKYIEGSGWNLNSSVSEFIVMP